MPTIKDIAARAGVSHGTVSNVLNKRGNVSAEKIQLVEQAARELGYQLNAQAQQLRAGVTKKVCVILPEIGIRRYSDFYTGLERGLHPFGFDIELICTDHLAHNEKTAAKKGAFPQSGSLGNYQLHGEKQRILHRGKQPDFRREKA